MENYERVEVKTRHELRQWLKQHHHSQKQSIWLMTYKKHSPHYLPYDHMVEEALCFGWIDSVQKKVDQDRSRYLLSPRRPKSVWSASNKKRVEKLVQQKKMTKAGLEKIEQAKQDGSWTFLDDVEALVIPEDLVAKLNQKRNAQAKQNFDAFNASSKKGILAWIKLAKKPETRQKRIETTVEKAKDNQKPI